MTGDGRQAIARFTGQDLGRPGEPAVRLLAALAKTPAAAALQAEVEALAALQADFSQRLLDSGQERAVHWAALAVPAAPTLRQAWANAAHPRWIYDLTVGLGRLDALGWTLIRCDPDELLLLGDHPVQLDLAGAARLPLLRTRPAPSPYAAPEVFDAPEAVDLRTGIYAIGACWLSLALGEPLSAKHLAGRGLKHLSASDPAVDPALSRTIARACHPDPARRYQSIAQFQSVLSAPKKPASAPLAGVTMLSDVGLTRNANQDIVWAERLGSNRLFLLLADGMGGEVGGAQASKLAVETMSKVMANLPPRSAEPEILACLQTAVNKANRVIYDRAQANPQLKGMGTTVVACLLEEETRRLYLVNVGDSLAFRLAGPEVELLSEEHTVTGEMVAEGSLALEDAIEHPHYGRLLRNLGHEPSVDSFVQSYVLARDEHLLLCSDGLTSAVKPSELAAVLAASASLDEMGRRLVNLANQREGHDNISLILV